MTISDATRFRAFMAEDVFRDNEVLNLSRGGQGAKLGAISLMTIARPMEPLEEPVWQGVLLGLKRVAEAFPLNRLWLCVCEGGPDNRVTLVKRLKGLMKGAGLQLAGELTGEMSEVKGGGGRYFFGAIDVTDENQKQFRNVVTPTSRSFLVSLPNGTLPDVAAMRSLGWWRGVFDFEELRELAIEIAAQNGVLFRPFGVFDDREVGVDLLAAPRQLFALRLDEGELA